MRDLMKLIQERHSARVPFDSRRPIGQQDLRQILEAASWAPTAHNMQNYEVVVVDDSKLLDAIGNIEAQVSETFIRENYQQLSFSEEELQKKRVGLLATMFPPSWRSPQWKNAGEKIEDVAFAEGPSFMKETIRTSPTLLFVIYDPRKRAPASEGDVLGSISLGCVMENMWLMAESLGIGFQIMSAFSGERVEDEVKRILEIPDRLKIAFSCRLGYPVGQPPKILRVRRKVEDFVSYNRFGAKGFR
jgi:nitroreductase